MQSPQHKSHANVGWAVGEFGTVLRTADGGRSWARQHFGATGRLTNISFSGDARSGWVLGSDGSWFTQDAGVSWARKAPLLDFQLGFRRIWTASDGRLVVAPDSDAGFHGSGTFTASPQQPDYRFVPLWLAAVTQPQPGLATWHGMIIDGRPGPRQFGRSTDAGLSWTAQSSLPPELWLQALGVVEYSPNNVQLWAQVALPQFLQAADGSQSVTYTRNQLARSRDDGKTWGDLLNLPTDRHLLVKVLRADSRGLGWSWPQNPPVTPGGPLLSLESTADGGRSWAAVRSPAGVPTAPLFDDQWLIDRSNSSSPWVSSDQGLTWARISLPGPPVRLLGSEPGVLMYLGASAEDGDRIYRSRDRGQTWTQTPYDPARTDAFGDLWLFDDLSGLALSAGSSGNRAYATSDGGRSWRLSSAAPMPKGGLHFTADGVGYGWPNLPSRQVGYLRSTDRGRSWTGQPMPGNFDNPALLALRFLDSRFGWALVARIVCSVRSCSYTDHTLFATEDGGAIWSQRFQGSNELEQLSLAFATANVAVRVDRAGRLLRSVNGGRDWAAITGPGLPTALEQPSAIHFVDNSVGFVSQSGYLLRTLDGGATWQRIDLPPAQAPDAPLTAAWVVQRMHFTDARNGFAITGADVLLSTSDGGLSWSAQRLGFNLGLAALFALDSQRIWLGGSRGAILATATGGHGARP